MQNSGQNRGSASGERQTSRRSGHSCQLARRISGNFTLHCSCTTEVQSRPRLRLPTEANGLQRLDCAFSFICPVGAGAPSLCCPKTFSHLFLATSNASRKGKMPTDRKVPIYLLSIAYLHLRMWWSAYTAAPIGYRSTAITMVIISHFLNKPVTKNPSKGCRTSTAEEEN